MSRWAFWLLWGATATVLRADGLDRAEDALTLGAESWSARVSGTLDLEGYALSQPAPGLIDADGAGLFSPRLTLFLDAQAGEAVYAFAQARVDRGFDPAAEALRGRLDEYAVRITPWSDGRLNFQAGKFATVVGSWVARHGSWQDGFITAPAPYENLTGLWDAVAAPSTTVLLAWAHVRPASPAGTAPDDKYLRLPVIWGPSYATGAAVSGSLGHWDYAVELKNAALSSRPEVWAGNERSWRAPAVNARIGFRPGPRWTFGWSAGTGSYLRAEAAPTLAPGASLQDYRETVLGLDAGYAWHHWQVWSEVLTARFAIPAVGTVETRAGYVETKVKLTARWFASLRWNRQVFSTVSTAPGDRLPWGNALWRVDLAPGFRFTPHVQWKLQYSLQHEERAAHALTPLVATQLTVRF